LSLLGWAPPKTTTGNGKIFLDPRNLWYQGETLLSYLSDEAKGDEIRAESLEKPLIRLYWQISGQGGEPFVCVPIINVKHYSYLEVITLRIRACRAYSIQS